MTNDPGHLDQSQTADSGWLARLRIDLTRCYRSCRFLDADDVAAEVFAVLIESYRHLVGTDAGRATAFGIGRIMLAEAARKKKSAAGMEPLEKGMHLACRAANPTDTFAQPTLGRTALRLLLRGLSPVLSKVTRAVLHCLLRGHTSSTEIAATLQLSVRTIERARTALSNLAVGVVQMPSLLEKLSPAAMYLRRCTSTGSLRPT